MNLMIACGGIRTVPANGPESTALLPGLGAFVTLDTAVAGGEMVSQGSLEPLFQVRVLARELLVALRDEPPAESRNRAAAVEIGTLGPG